MSFIPGSPIKFKRWIISLIHFEMDGVHAHLASFFLKKHDRLLAIPASSECYVNKQLVDKRIVPVKFKAEPDCQNNVADGQVPFAEKPDSPKDRKRQKPPERCARRGFIKLNFSRLLLGQ